MRIALTGGGTGGHLFPLIAVAKELKNISMERGLYNTEIRFYGPQTTDESLYVALAEENIKFESVMSGKIRRYFSLQNPIDLIKFAIGIFQAQWKLFKFMPDVIFSKGGYGSLPIVLVGWLFGIPIIIHESDSIPGLVNKISSKFAKRIAIAFPSAAKYFKSSTVAILGNPTREDLKTGTIEEAKTILALKGDKPLILIIGGSQGARALNDLVMNSLNDLLLRYEVILVCGEKNYADLFNESAARLKSGQKEYFHLFPFLKSELKHAFAASSLIVSRSGAGSIFEIAFLGKPSILVPLPSSAQDHQVENAYEYSKFGSTIVMEQQNMTPHLFLDNISRVLSDENLFRQMSENALKFFTPQAARKIAEEIFYWGEI